MVLLAQSSQAATRGGGRTWGGTCANSHTAEWDAGLTSLLALPVNPFLLAGYLTPFHLLPSRHL